VFGFVCYMQGALNGSVLSTFASVDELEVHLKYATSIELVSGSPLCAVSLRNVKFVSFRSVKISVPSARRSGPFPAVCGRVPVVLTFKCERGSQVDIRSCQPRSRAGPSLDYVDNQLWRSEELHPYPPGNSLRASQ